MKEKKRGFLGSIEKVGNALPHPAMIFVALCVIIAVLSQIFAKMGVSVNYTALDRTTNEITDMTASIVSLLSPEGIRYMFTSAVTNFTGFAPLGTVLVAIIGVGVAEGTGLIGALLTKLVTSTPKKLITVVVVFAGVMSSIASDAGYVVLIPLGAVIFMSFGRHPLAGIAAAFAGVSGGFSANLMVGSTDALLAGITTEAAKLSATPMEVGVSDNWFFLIASTFLITIIGTIVTEKIVEPRLGEYKGNVTEKLTSLTDEQRRGLKFAGIGLVLTIIAFALLIGGKGEFDPITKEVIKAPGILRNQTNGEILTSPFMSSIVVVISLLFLVPGIAYGIGAKVIKKSDDAINLMGKSMSTMGGYIILVFFAAQFVAYFSYTNMGTVIAVKGADFLQNIGLKGIPLILLFILVSAFINIFMGSASAKWAIMAPIFVPMLMQMGYSPALTQMAYRIGDSTTNLISPLMSYFALIVAFSQKYDEEAGAGTIISTMLPYSIALLIGWSLLLVVWYVLGLPLGPGVGIAI